MMLIIILLSIVSIFGVAALLVSRNVNKSNHDGPSPNAELLVVKKIRVKPYLFLIPIKVDFHENQQKEKA